MWWTFWTSTGGRSHFPAFNVADMGIILGAIFLILDEVLRAKRAKVKN
jgi:signal peptidase II